MGFRCLSFEPVRSLTFSASFQFRFFSYALPLFSSTINTQRIPSSTCITTPYPALLLPYLRLQFTSFRPLLLRPFNPDPHPHCLFLFILIDPAIVRHPGFLSCFIFDLDTLTAQASHTTSALSIDRAHITLSSSRRQPPLSYASSLIPCYYNHHPTTSLSSFVLFHCPPFIS